MNLIPSEKYRLMIYFGHSTMVMYSKDIVLDAKMTYGEFADINKDLIKRVCDESLSIFNYELSHEQIGRIIKVYISSALNPQSVKDTEVYISKNYTI